jgi:hypothetical protein
MWPFKQKQTPQTNQPVARENARFSRTAKLCSAMNACLFVLLVSLAFASQAAPDEEADFHIQVSNEAILLNGSEIESVAALRSRLQHIPEGSSVSVEAHMCTKWQRVDEVMQIFRQRKDGRTIKFRTSGHPDDMSCRRSRGTV